MAFDNLLNKISNHSNVVQNLSNEIQLLQLQYCLRYYFTDAVTIVVVADFCNSLKLRDLVYIAALDDK